MNTVLTPREPVKTLSKEARDRLIERQMKKDHEARLWMEVGMWDGQLWYCGEIYPKVRKPCLGQTK